MSYLHTAMAVSMLAGSLCAEDAIRLKAGPVDLRVPRASSSRHYLLHFSTYPGVEVREELDRRGIQVLGFVPDSTLMVSSAVEADLDGLDLTWAGSLTAAEKLSPQLNAGVSAGYLVIFHEDVAPAVAARILRRDGFVILERAGLLANHQLVLGAPEDLAGLAAEDEVSYILPASSELLDGDAVAACPGALTDAGPIGEYAEMGRGWAKGANGVATLQYVIQSITAKIPENAVRSEIARALGEWARYAAVAFVSGTDGSAGRTIAIQFARGAHGDPYPFDGPGRVLAHTFYPSPLNSEPIAGDMHLDADEDWHVAANVDLFSVALHEAGHALGLAHSDKPGSVMYPYYRLVTGLSDDDIAGIRDLYGAAVVSSEPPGGPSVPPVAPPVPPSPPPPPAPPAADHTAPSLRILSPGWSVGSVYSPSIAISGTATDDVAVASVRWSTSNGASGTASGTTAWSAEVPLLVGNNVVTVRAYDGAGNSAWRAIVVVRR